MVEFIGHLLAFAGDWERGCELGERARELNPHHPKWYWALPFLDAYRKGDYRGARAFIRKMQHAREFLRPCLERRCSTGRSVTARRLRRPCEICSALRPDFAAIARDRAREVVSRRTSSSS